jgi:hypothetical protein
VDACMRSSQHSSGGTAHAPLSESTGAECALLLAPGACGAFTGLGAWLSSGCSRSGAALSAAALAEGPPGSLGASPCASECHSHSAMTALHCKARCQRAPPLSIRPSS